MARGRRSRRRERPGPSGFLVVDKPGGRTSHDLVDYARERFGTRRVGHLGTLDPQATGVLPLAVRDATKLVPFLPSMQKAYVGTVRFGSETDTLDAQGKVLRNFEGELPSEEEVRGALEGFVGEIEQIPPMFSAVKKDGVPLHRLARRGEEVERDPKRVTIERLELMQFESPDAEISVLCGPGTYVRTLAADVGERLGCGAHLKSLRRLQSGPFQITQALTLEQLDEEARAGKLHERLIGLEEALQIDEVVLRGESVRRLCNGGDVSPGVEFRRAPGTRVIAKNEEGRPIALVELKPDRRLWPLRVFRGS
ncbi:MAG: tRNA pseudouridine(55) synthase TruB [Myxococcota bacterium]